MVNPDKRVIIGGRYEIIRYLGGGGFGQTYLAEDTHLPGNPSCVVKHLKPRLTDTLSLETAQRLFETEAQVLYRLNEYDRIPNLLAHFEEEQEFYLVQEFIEGENLGHVLMPGSVYSEAQTIPLLLDVLEVLVFLHQNSVIHRDLKPSNLIRRKRDSRVVLIDFGAVKQLTTQIVQVQSNTTRTIAIGSPGYMPTEQMAGRPRFSSDLYAVGMIGIQALTGLHPNDLPEDPRTGELLWRDRADVTSALGDILDRMVRYDFRERYQSAIEVIRELSTLNPDGAALVLDGLKRRDRPNQDGDTNPQFFTQPMVGAPAIISEKGIDYTHLQTLLKAGDWKAADEETLALMLRVCDRTSGRLTLDDMRHFPCLDLFTLDYLWMDHSNCQFGFSVQKEIWQSVGGRIDGTHQEWDVYLKGRSQWRVNSPWNRFANRVGWRVREHFIDYANYNFSLDAPKGHLPSWRNRIAISALFQRLDVCKPYMPKIDLTEQP